MPCNSDYMNQTPAEKHNQQAARILLWLDDKGVACLNKTSRWAVENADTYYSIDKGQVKTLCALIDDLEDKGLLASLIRKYALDKTARELADWFDAHKAQDARRETDEKSQVRRKKLDTISDWFSELPDDKLDDILKTIHK